MKITFCSETKSDWQPTDPAESCPTLTQAEWELAKSLMAKAMEEDPDSDKGEKNIGDFTVRIKYCHSYACDSTHHGFSSENLVRFFQRCEDHSLQEDAIFIEFNLSL